MLTPEDVLNGRFTATQLREGYEEGEVDALMDRVATALDALESGRGASPPEPIG